MIGGMQGHQNGDAAWHREQKGISTNAELNTFRQAAAHVTEDGKTRRSFTTSEGWAMVHADRLLDLEIAEERCAAVEKQRDELLAALEQFATWGRMQHKAQSKGCHATFDMMALRDEIDLAEAAIASVKEL